MNALRRLPQVVLGCALAYAGIGHLTTSRTEFQAQVPSLLEDYADFVVLASGVVEIALGVGLDTDTKRLVRLFFQPLLVMWALGSTGAWSARKRLKK